MFVHWKDSSPADATCEFLDEFRARFPDIHLKDKVLRGESNVME